MKKYLLLLGVAMVILTFYSCKKTQADNPDSIDEQPAENQDYGYIVVYTNDNVYTDPLDGQIGNDNIDVSIDNVSRGTMSSINTGKKIYYGTKNAVSVKLSPGNVSIKTTTTSGVVRTLNTAIIKDDTVRIKIDYGYKDPDMNSYYIEYYDNGTLKKYNVASTLPKWNFYINNYQVLTGTMPGCSNTNGELNFDGPRVIYSVGPSPLDLRIKRSSWKLKPSLGSYTYAASMLYSTFENANVRCDLPDSYAKVSVNEVKVIEDMGLEKRGYYTGNFDAIVYYQNGFFGTPVKHVITNGKFKLSMGGISLLQ